MGLQFEWDGNEAWQNVEKHGVSFEEAATVSGDPLSLTIDDPPHSQDELRFVTMGETVNREIVAVVHTERGDSIRISPRVKRQGVRGEHMEREGSSHDADVRREYGFERGVRGKYAHRYAEGTNVVVLSPDVAKAFPDSALVNKALRALIDIARDSAAG